MQDLDPRLHNCISSTVVFHNKTDTLKDALTQQIIRNGTIDLMQHIRTAIDLGNKNETDKV